MLDTMPARTESADQDTSAVVGVGSSVARMKVVDLFAGVGGLSLGAARAGFEVVAAVESDRYARDSHAVNFPNAVHIDTHIDAKYTGDALLEGAGIEAGSDFGLIGGPPCQGFSTIGRRHANDPRNDLFVEFFRLAAETRPLFFLVENVPGILNTQFAEKREAAFARVRNDYVLLEPFTAKASEFGAPTTRTRVFFVGVRRDASVQLSLKDFAPPADLETVKVKHALAGLPEDVDPDEGGEGSTWRTVTEPDGVPKAFGARVRDRLAGVGSPAALENLEKNLVSGFLATRHTADVVERFKALPLGGKDDVSKATRLDPEGFCPTIRAGTASDRGSYQAVRPVHPRQPRVITPREAARLQGFPDWFQFHDTRWHSFRQIGNSVSPIVGERLLSVVSRALRT